MPSDRRHFIDIQIEDKAWKTISLEHPALFKNILEKVASSLDDNRQFQLNILLTSDEKMKELNIQFRGKDAPTNVLSFESGLLNEKLQPVYLGDIAFGYEIIGKEATEEKKSFENHFIHLIVHGILHLFGYDHIRDDQADIMENLEINILESLQIPNPYSL